MAVEIEHLKTVERRLLWLSHWMIHNANHIRPKVDGIKIGGHQASSASMVSIMTALYFSALRPEDRVAVKPHASPVFHAMQYLMGNQTREKMENFRGFGGAQSYPSAHQGRRRCGFFHRLGRPGRRHHLLRLADPGLHRRQGLGEGRRSGRMIALVGDAELDEGNIYEACRKAGRTTCAIAGGSSTTTGSRSTASCARGCGSGSRRSSRPSAGTWCA
jgi:pyruvate dehydrogenase E1 component